LDRKERDVSDRAERTRYSELARQLATGRISNFEFEDRLPRLEGRTLREVHEAGLWCVYDDFHEHKLSGEWKLSRKQRQGVARIILFLKSGAEYRWPRRTGVEGALSVLLAMLTLGLSVLTQRIYLRSKGNTEVWPFLTRSEYEAALSQPVYFAGNAVQPSVPPDVHASAASPLRRGRG